MTDKQIKIYLKPINTRIKRATDQPPRAALDRLIAIDLEQQRLPELAKDMKRKSNSEDKTSIKSFLRLVLGLHSSRKISWPEYIFYVSSHLEPICDEEYNKELQAIDKKIEELEELEEGLQDNIEYQRLEKEYKQICDERFYQILCEFELYELAEIWKNDQKKYERLREKGRRAYHHEKQSIEALRDLIIYYEREACMAASAKAYFAAITMLGAAIEGLLLLRCLKSKLEAIDVAKKLPENKRPRFLNDPNKWKFEHLIETCLAAGWLYEAAESFDEQNNVAELAHTLRKMRNDIHPAKLIREKPWLELTEQDYQYAEDLYDVLLFMIDSRKSLLQAPARDAEVSDEGIII